MNWGKQWASDSPFFTVIEHTLYIQHTLRGFCFGSINSDMAVMVGVNGPGKLSIFD